MHWGSKSNVKRWDVIKIAMDARLVSRWPIKLQNRMTYRSLVLRKRSGVNFLYLLSVRPLSPYA